MRVLEVLEAIAAHAPIGVSALARLLDADKNAVQRAIVTLAEAGWIAAAPGPSTRWELTGRVIAVAYRAHGKNDLRMRAKAELERLGGVTGETALLTLADGKDFVVVEVVESPHVLNASPSLGAIASPHNSSTGRAVLAFLGAEEQAAALGSAPDAGLLEQFEATRRCGYAVVVGGPMEGVTSIAAPIFDLDGKPTGAVVVAGPTGRVSAGDHARIGALVAEAARGLSRGEPRPASAAGVRS